MISQLYWLYIEWKMLRVNLIGRIRVFWGLRSGTGLSFTFGSWSGSFSRVVSGWSGSTPPGSATLSENPTLTFYTNPCSMYSRFLTTLYFCLSFPSFTLLTCGDVPMDRTSNGSSAQPIGNYYVIKFWKIQCMYVVFVLNSIVATLENLAIFRSAERSIRWKFDPLGHDLNVAATWFSSMPNSKRRRGSLAQLGEMLQNFGNKEKTTSYR